MGLTGASEEDAKSYLLMAPEGTVESAAALYFSHQSAGSTAPPPEEDGLQPRVDELMALTGASKEDAQTYLLMAPEGTVESAAALYFSHLPAESTVPDDGITASVQSRTDAFVKQTGSSVE